MDRLDKIIGDIAYVLDSLRNLRKIYQTGDCNTCDNKECQHKPKVGQMVRYNCYDYKGLYRELTKWVRRYEMAYSDYGAFVWLNGKRREDKEDVAIFASDIETFGTSSDNVPSGMRIWVSLLNQKDKNVDWRERGDINND